MPAGPIGSCWASSTWSDTAWEANTWADAQVGGGGGRVLLLKVGVWLLSMFWV